MLLALLWTVSFIETLVFYYGYGTVPEPGQFCYIGFPHLIQGVVSGVVYGVYAFLTMTIFSIIFLVTYCTKRGQQLKLEVPGSFTACLATVLTYAILSLAPTLTTMFANVSPAIYMAAFFFYNCANGAICLIWILTCKDIRASALFRAAPSGEKSELLPKE